MRKFFAILFLCFFSILLSTTATTAPLVSVGTSFVATTLPPDPVGAIYYYAETLPPDPVGAAYYYAETLPPDPVGAPVYSA